MSEAEAESWTDFSDGSPEASLMMDSGRKDTGRLGLVRQREFIDHPRQLQRHVEVGAHGRPPGLFNRQGQHLRCGIDVTIKRIGGHYCPIHLGSNARATADAGSPSAALLYRHPA